MKRAGFKARGKPLQSRRPLAVQSAKRKAYRASAERADAVAHMLAVKALPCIACSAPPPSYAHHCTSGGMARSDWHVIPLCYACHQGPRGYHASKRAWVARHGEDVNLVPRVYAALGKDMPG